MEYYAEYTVLIDSATWGREDYYFEAENDKEAIEMALKHEENVEIRGGRAKELLLDYIYNDEGKELSWERR